MQVRFAGVLTDAREAALEIEKNPLFRNLGWLATATEGAASR